MTVQMDVAKAKAKLSQLIARAEAGEDVFIARRRKPVVVLSPCSEVPTTGMRKLGFWDHCGPLEDPYMFLRPEPDLEELMETSVFE
jgi:prevent-host-death family protein